MKYLLSIALLIGISFAANAQQKTKTENIRQLLVAMGAVKQVEQTFSLMMESYKQQATGADEKFWEDFAREVKAQDLVDMLIPIYDKHYSDEEIRHMLAFYSSPLGQKIVEKTPSVTQASYKAGEEWGRKIGEKVAARLQSQKN